MKKYYIYATTIGHIANDSSQSVLPALLPYFVMKYGISLEQAGAIVFANTALASVLQPMLGYYSDKLNAPRFIALGILLSTFSIASLAFATSYWYIILAAVCAGAGSALFHPEAAKLANKLGGAQVGKSIGTFAFGGSVGHALGPIIAGICVYQLGVHSLLVYAVMGLVMGGFFFIAMPRIMAHTKVLQQELAKQIPKEQQVPPQNDWKSFSKLSVILFARAMNFSVLNAFIPIYWVTILGLSAKEGGYALTVLFSVGAIVTFVGGMLADRFGFVKIIRYALLLWVPATFCLTNVHNVYWAWFLLLPVGFARNIVYSPVVVLGQRYLAKSVGFASGITLGLTMTFGGMLAPGVGALADTYGLQQALQILNVSTVVALIMSFFLTETNQKMKTSL